MPTEHTGRDRIVQAALREFADSGFDGASIRGIAARAGVSPALVQHHFGTKARLREECDQYVLAGVRVGQGEPGFAGLGPFTDLAAASEAVLDYWSRALADDAPPAQRLFDRVVEQVLVDLRGRRGLGEADGDLEALAVAVAVLQLAPMTLHRMIRRRLDPQASTLHALGRFGFGLLALLDPAAVPEPERAVLADAYRAMLADELPPGDPAAS